MDNILDIIYDYSINNKLLDKNAIKSIIDISIDTCNIDTIYEVNFAKCPIKGANFTLAGYDANGIIKIYTNAIEKEIAINAYMTYFEVENELNEFEKFTRKNLHLLYIILHEIEHAKQIQLVRDINNKSIERNLICAEYNYVNPIITDPFTNLFDVKIIANLIKHRIIYESSYDISFMERLANYYSLNDIKDMSKLLSDNLYELQDLVLMRNLLGEYENENDSPTIRFFNKINKSKVLEKIPKLEYKERLKYGLSLSKEEYTLINNKINRN